MSRTKVDVDALLSKDQLEITVGGKTFFVKDVPLDLFLEASKIVDDASDEAEKDPKVLHRQLAKLFEVDIEKVLYIGFRAAALCIQEITRWVYEKTEETGGEGSKEPNP